MSHLAYGTVALTAIGLVFLVRAHSAHKRLLNESEAALKRIYTAKDCLPQIALAYRYGYPAFTVKFQSKQELQIAEEAGLNDIFKREIDALCSDRVRAEAPYTAEQGVYFTYDG